MSLTNSHPTNKSGYLRQKGKLRIGMATVGMHSIHYDTSIVDLSDMTGMVKRRNGSTNVIIIHWMNCSIPSYLKSLANPLMYWKGSKCRLQ